MSVYRMIHPFFIALVFVLPAIGVQGQGAVKIYSPATAGCRDLVQTPDGGYFMAGEIALTGQMFLQKINPVGNVVWTNHLSLNGARAIATCLTAESDFIVLAENYADTDGLKNVVFKLSASGTLLWQTVVDNTFLPNGLHDIIKTSDNNFLAAGDTRDAQLNQDVRLVKFDQTGGVLWSKTLGDPVFNEQCSRLLELPGGDIAVSGSAMHGTDSDLFLIKTTASGNQVWEKWYAKPLPQLAYDLISMSDGGLLLLGDTYGSNPTKITLLKTDADGNELLFSQLYPWPVEAVNALYNINSFVRDAADNVYIPGYISAGFNSPENIFLLKADADGQVVWNKSIDQAPADIPWQIILTSDNFLAIGGGMESFSGAFWIKTNNQGDVYTNKISGSIYHDANDNCQPDSGEPSLTNFIVRAENQSGEVFYKNVAPAGTYLMPVSEGNFTVSVVPVYGSQNFWQPCDNQVVAVAGAYQTVQAPPLGLRSEADCPQMFVEIATPRLRRCTTNVYNIVYCNNGNVAATGASVQLALSDPELSYNNSSIPLTGQNGNVLTFSIPDVPPGYCGSFNVGLSLDCAAELGDVYCVEAHIFPDTICPAPGALWDGSHLEVTGDCNSDVSFTVTNTGSNMAGTVDYVIVEDQIMYLSGSMQLNSGEDTVIVVPNPTGGPYFIRVDQRPGHPGLDAPSAIVSPCGGAPAASALQFPENDADPFVSEFCDEVIGSYDPNDKRGFPLGWKDEHYIEPQQELEYMIRFQNTGTDTAFQVLIRDTISTLLNPGSIRPGPSSHPYTYEISGAGILIVRFTDILLPDSTVNEPASHGFVSFHIAQQPDLAHGAVIENRAAIYFDFNDPVITNTTFHTVGHPFTAVVDISDVSLKVFPNPVAEQVLFHLDGLASNTSVRLLVFNAQGKMEREEAFTGTDYTFHRNRLPQGVYFFRLECDDKRAASGRIIFVK